MKCSHVYTLINKKQSLKTMISLMAHSVHKLRNATNDVTAITDVGDDVLVVGMQKRLVDKYRRWQQSWQMKMVDGTVAERNAWEPPMYAPIRSTSTHSIEQNFFVHVQWSSSLLSSLCLIITVKMKYNLCKWCKRWQSFWGPDHQMVRPASLWKLSF
jgi:hypothetical protein